MSVVKHISEPILNSGRNITMDNWFTSIPLVIDLLDNFNTTVVGTIKKKTRKSYHFYLERLQQ